MTGVYNRLLYNMLLAGGKMTTDDIKVMLMDNVHTFDRTDNVLADISANEAVGTGYSRISLSAKTVTQGNPTIFDADDVIWNDITISAYHLVIYNATTDDLIASIDFGGEVEVQDGGILKIQFNASGIITLTN